MRPSAGFLLLACFALAAFPLRGGSPSPSSLPKDARPLALEAAQACQKNDYVTAQAKYRAIIQLHPDCLFAWTNLGVIYFNQQRLKDALAAFQKAAQINPKDAFIRFQLGVTFFELDALTEAEQNLKTCLTLAPTAPEPHRFLALIYEKQNRPAEARQEKARYQELKQNTPSPAPGKQSV